MTEVYGWDEKALLSGKQAPKQATIFHEDFGERKGKTDVKKTNGPLKLEDFY